MKARLLSRRTLLRGMGLGAVAVALPQLEAMRHPAWAQARTAPRRLVLFHFPNGVEVRDWIPGGTDAAPVLTAQHAPLAPHLREINFVVGLSSRGPHDVAVGNVDDHQRTQTAFATGVPVTTAGAGGPSFDQVAARALAARAGAPRLPSLVVATRNENSVFHRTVSWSGRNAPIEPIKQPMELFTQLFGGGAVPADDAAARRARRRQSVLDHVREQVAAVRGVVSASDRVRLDEHLTALRDLERAAMAATTPVSCATPAAPASNATLPSGAVGAEFDQRTRLLLDLLVMALRCDLTRVVSFSLNSTNNTSVYTHLGLRAHDHDISHYREGAGGAGAAVNRDAYTRMTAWKMGHLAYLLDALARGADGSGTLLDSCVLVAGSEMSNGDWHSSLTLPVIVAGRAGGMAGGRVIRTPCARGLNTAGSERDIWASWCARAGADTPLSNLWLTALRAMEVPETQFGNSTGTVPGLWV